uniref:EF-hand domain-containing protein n=1 Tax=Myoviridae sp. ctagO6 TaxID=2826667 RepID=A0A8S5NNP7_9CAUD|nr:MAG TPA: hypothetical protein [Myoviridae sp. ctagO6]
MGIRSQSDKIRKKSKAEETGSRAGSTRPASVSSEKPKAQNFDEWTRAKNAKDFDEWTRIRNGQTEQQQPGVSMRQGTQTSTAESRLSQRRFEATSFPSYKLRDEAIAAQQRADDDTLDRKIELTLERLQTTLPKKETPAGMVNNPEYQALYDALSGYQAQKKTAEQEAKDAADAYNSASGMDAKKIAGLYVAPYFKKGTNISDATALLDEYLTYQDAMQNGVVGAGDKWKTARAALIGAGLSEDSIDEAADIWRRASNSEAMSLSNQSLAEATREHPILASALSVPLSITSGLGYLDLATQKIGNPDKAIDFNTGTMRAAGAGTTIRETAVEDMNGLESFLYQTGMSMADSTAIAALSQLGVPGASVLLSGSAATSAAREAKERGGTDAQALGYGLAAGIAEGLFETVSLEMLTKNAIGRLGRQAAEQAGAKRILTLLKSAGIQAATEGSEEVFTTIANTISDAVIMGDKSEYAQNKQLYMDAGMSEGEAEKKAAEDWLTGILGDFLGGALSGGIMGGTASAISANTQYTFDDEIPNVDLASRQETPQDILQRVAMESVQEQASPENTQRIMEQMTETPQQAMERLASETVAPRAEPAYNGNINETEAGNNGREDLYLRGSGERNDSQNPGGQVSAVEEDAGRDQSRDVQTRPADGGAASLTYGEKISTKALGIANGSTTGTVRLVKSGETEATRAAAKLAEENGVKLVLFGGGNLRVKNKNGAYVEARGMKIGDTIYCRADHARYTAEQLTRHEIGHKWIADGEVNVDAVKEKLAERFAPEELDHLAGMYIDAYGSTELTANEVWEEAICDALGFMNMFDGFAEEGDAAVFLVESGRAAREVREETKAAKAGKFSIEALPDGKKYVRADRQVIFGNDAESWSEQLERYINGKIRKGQDVVLIGADGDELRLTATSAGKLSDNHTSDGRTMSDTAYERKVNAATHIDELVETSHRGKKTAHDDDSRHGDMASSGWNYRTAYFKDFDGTYYKVTISASKNSSGSMVYNIGKMQERSIPQISGSSAASSGALRGNASSDKRVSEDGSTVKQKFSRELSIDRLNEENDLLQQAIEGFRENGETMGAVSEQDAEKVARKIIREYSGTITADDISGDVRELSGMIERGDWDAAKAKAMEISQGVINSALAESEGQAESAELYKEIKKTLRNEKILISREASRDIPDYNQWRKRYFGRLNVKIADGDTGVSGVDAVYERLSGKYPGIFKPGALAESDALLSIADALDKMRPELANPHGYYMTEATEYCANELINLLAGDRMKQAAPNAAERIETLASEGRTRTQEALDKLREAYGTIKPGENPSREVALPKKTSERKHLSQTVRTILESNVTPDVALPTIEQAVLDGDFSYTRYSDEAAISDAKETIQNKGWDQSLEDWKKEANKGIISKENTAIGWALYDNAVNDGNMETAMDILGKIVTQQRNAAQAVQATRILKKLSPEALLYQVSRSVANIQEELKRRYKDKAPKLKINEEYAEEFLNAKTEKERDAASEKLFRDIGRQVPTTFRDRWNAWRYLAMLMNPRTHIRNIVGNAGFAPVVFVKDLTAMGIEKAVSVVSGGRIERSKSPVLTSKAGRALLKEGWSDYNNVADEVSAGKKYSDSAMQNQQVEAGRRIFGNTRFQAWNKTGGRALEAARKGNSYALEAEDVWFSKPHYAYAFAQYSKASGITAEQIRNGTVDEVKLARARDYAIHEAQKATYHDTNDFSEALSKFGRYSGENKVVKGLSVAAEGILPFRKTPANILARGVEYSPLGFLNGLKKAMFDVRKGNSTAAEAIDRISSGLTGTGLLALGVYLAAQGVVRGLGAGDDDEREFAELQGQQAYSMIIGDQSYTLDWLAPEALPFFIGVNLLEEMQTSGGDVTLASILSAVSHISEPMLSMTCLQGLNAMFESVGYASQEGLSGGVNAIASAATSYLTQALPTILGQLERTAQSSRMTTYTEKNGFLTGDVQYALGKASSRTPGWDYNQIPYIDAWGRRETTSSLFTRGVNNFLNPAYASTVESSDMEKELERLYGETSSSAVFPSRAAKYFNVDGERVDLTAKQYVSYAAWKGQLSYKLMTELVGTDYYKQADDADKAELVSKVYEYANAVAKTKVSGYKLDGWVEKAADAEKYGVSVTEYLRWKSVGTENFSSTAYATAVKSGSAGKVETELSRLDAAVDSSAFPSAADKKFSVDKQQVELTDSQYAKYAEEKGGLSYQYVAELVGDDFYKAASDKEKGKMVSAVYEYANAVAKTKVSDYTLDGWCKKAADAKSYGVSVTQYIWFHSIADADGNGSVTQEEAAEAVRALGLTSRTAKAKLWQSCNEKWKNNPF